MGTHKDTPEPTATRPAAVPADPSQAVAEQVAAMMYISESEAPLELLQWPDVTEAAAARNQIASLHNVSPESLEDISAADFLQSIQQMADPADAVMVAYADSYTALFELLNKSFKDVGIIKCGEAPVQVYILGFNDAGCTAIHTTAVET